MGSGASLPRRNKKKLWVKKSKSKTLTRLWSSMHLADEGSMEFVNKLLAAKAPLDHERSMDGLTPLIVAARDGHVQALETLLEAKATVNYPSASAGGTSPLHIASEIGDVDVVDVLLDAKAVVDQRQHSDGSAPLVTAARHGHMGVVMELLLASAMLDLPTRDGSTPLYVAAQHGHTPIVDVLLEAKATVDLPVLQTNSMPMNAAASNGHLDVVNALLAHAANPDNTTVSHGPWDEVVPLMSAAHHGHTAVVRALLAGRACPDVASPGTGVTPLIAAAMCGHTQIVRELLASKADASPRTNAEVRTMKSCPNGHLLLQHAVRGEEVFRQCDTCNKQQSLGTAVFSCSLCEYVVCPSCTDDVIQQTRQRPHTIVAGTNAHQVAKDYGHKGAASLLALHTPLPLD